MPKFNFDRIVGNFNNPTKSSNATSRRVMLAFILNNEVNNPAQSPPIFSNKSVQPWPVKT